MMKWKDVLFKPLTTIKRLTQLKEWETMNEGTKRNKEQKIRIIISLILVKVINKSNDKTKAKRDKYYIEIILI